MNHSNTYLKQRNTNTAVHAHINVRKTCQGHVLNQHFSTTHWTFHFETAVKRVVRYVTTVLQKCIQRHVFPMSLGCYLQMFRLRIFTKQTNKKHYLIFISVLFWHILVHQVKLNENEKKIAEIKKVKNKLNKLDEINK